MIDNFFHIWVFKGVLFLKFLCDMVVIAAFRLYNIVWQNTGTFCLTHWWFVKMCGSKSSYLFEKLFPDIFNFSFLSTQLLTQLENIGRFCSFPLTWFLQRFIRWIVSSILSGINLKQSRIYYTQYYFYTRLMYKSVLSLAGKIESARLESTLEI